MTLSEKDNFRFRQIGSGYEEDPFEEPKPFELATIVPRLGRAQLDTPLRALKAEVS